MSGTDSGDGGRSAGAAVCRRVGGTLAAPRRAEAAGHCGRDREAQRQRQGARQSHGGVAVVAKGGAPEPTPDGTAADGARSGAAKGPASDAASFASMRCLTAAASS